MALGDFDADPMHIYYLRNQVLMFLFPIFHCRKEKLSLYFTFFPYMLVIYLSLFFFWSGAICVLKDGKII